MVMRAAWRSVRALVVGVGLLVLVLLAAVLIDRGARTLLHARLLYTSPSPRDS